MAAAELSIKLVIDTKAHKVCFAEAGSDFVEFLSSLLCLPVSNIINLLTKEHMVGSIANVFDSVEKLDADHVISNESKEPYLKPMVAPGALCPLQQLIDAQLDTDTSFFTCEGKLNHYHGIRVACGYFTVMKGSICPKCGYAMEKAMAHVKATGFVVGTARYTVKDDLSIVPASSVSTISLLAQCGVKDLSTLQERTVKIGKEEALEILLASLRTKTVLTDVFLLKKKFYQASHLRNWKVPYKLQTFIVSME
ncbi:Os01g0154300 [Oryza sativa Japonica Group]|nr:Os01g0154300 [Oryza sativa Japonica Group]|eukprot:NP_001042059.2 Os01g0154300 [Oryza sativa Japonica Group]